MPTPVAALFEIVGVPYGGAVAWGSRVPESAPGVYVVSFTQNPADDEGREECPISMAALEQLMETRPAVTVDGEPATVDNLANRLSAFWLSDEPVLYIGKATSLGSRVNSYYRTKLGARSPHAGGWWLKTLTCLDDLAVHYGPTLDTDRSPSVAAAEAAESQMVRHFVQGVSDSTRQSLWDQAHPLPFANLRHPKGPTKAHAIRRATG